MSLDELYKEVILDHYRTPRNRGRLDPHDVKLERNNPLCGDELELYLKFDGEDLEGIAFEGKGCSISMASASMMTEKVKGLDVKQARAVAESIKRMMAGEEPGDINELGDLVSLKGVVKYPVRIKCALLGWNTLLEGLDEVP
ncbi:MAG TPA: SUF system NifU family Fe-S cluster assembly protein [Actinomycetota bacterium]|jgi:nitrogen fixation NifU-like protein|nr:SUF system NifU family Fe-S cluster assembly protein [Actinomycetota bacterium]MDQ5874465.1 SUF system NifU family Fe-S cluster assembly protein [Actinomycetota bacterium]HZJ52140.1 SUF system NifU family Fe-S cluster assembly protein [Actinomycetota bacterium]